MGNPKAECISQNPANLLIMSILGVASWGMADHSEDPGLGILQQRAPTSKASGYRVPSKRSAEDSGDKSYSHNKSSMRLRQRPDTMTSDNDHDSGKTYIALSFGKVVGLIPLQIDHNAMLPTSVHGKRKRDQERELQMAHPPSLTIDWRTTIIRSLNIPHNVSDDELIEAMNEISGKLKEVDQLRVIAKMQKAPHRMEVIHTVRCSSSSTKKYLGQLEAVKSGLSNIHLRGSQSINNFELFLERNKEIAFIVYKEYECCNMSRTSPRREHGEMGVEVNASTLLRGEYIHLLADELRTALADIVEAALSGIPHPDFNRMSDSEEEDMEDRVSYPYMWYYHGRREIDQAIKELKSELSPEKRRVVDLFRSYILDRMSADWTAVDALLKEGMMSAKYMNYLFVSIWAFFCRLPNHLAQAENPGSRPNRNLAAEREASLAGRGLRH